MIPLVILGAGGHGRVVLELLRALGDLEPLGFIDDAPSAPAPLGLPVLGGQALLPRLRAEGITHAFIAIGANALRQQLGEALIAQGFILPSLAHPAAFLSPSARLGAGALVMARAVLGTEATMAPFAILNTGAIADHDNQLGTACHVAPGCALAGLVRVGARTLVGTGSAVKPGVSIGDDVVIGAGAAVAEDVASGRSVMGVPAR